MASDLFSREASLGSDNPSLGRPTSLTQNHLLECGAGSRDSVKNCCNLRFFTGPVVPNRAMGFGSKSRNKRVAMYQQILAKHHPNGPEMFASKLLGFYM